MAEIDSQRLSAMEHQLRELSKPDAVRQAEYAARTANWRDVIAQKQLRRRAENIRHESALANIREARRARVAPQRAEAEREWAAADSELADVRELNDAAERKVLKRREAAETCIRSLDAEIDAQPSEALLAEALADEPSVEDMLKPTKPKPTPGQLRRERVLDKLRGVL